jgi:hypothetical protein
MPAAAALCHAGKQAEFDRFRDTIISRFSATRNPQVAEQLLKASLIRPLDAETLRRLDGVAALLEAAVDEPRGWIASDPYLAGWSCFILGLKAYRESDHRRATLWLHRSLAYPGDNRPKDVSVRLVLAMIDSLEGRKSNAHLGIQMAREPVEKAIGDGTSIRTDQGGFWFDWINAELLLDEALRTLAP